ncbi:MAG: aspartate carbamoyltransferase [Candidatus Paceibacterota bacterium]|jgi:aspartate carbamoyltransferase catalytic subunit
MINILSTKQFSKDDIESILSRASVMEKDLKDGTAKKLLADKVIACVFFEPSTRTRLSFETAAIRLGANIISVENAEVSSSAFKGESIEDTTRMLSCYADAIVMRHHKAGAAEVAASVSTKPILNAGDGANQHPSQALLDVYTIKKEHGRLDNLSIAFVGDLKNSRPLHSLMPIFMFYPNNTFYFISPQELVISEELRQELKDKNIKFIESQNLEETLPKVDVLYMTRVQKERFTNIEDYEKVKDSFLLKKEHLELMKKESIILHPLPRVNEIDKEIDNDHRACYFREAQNGLYVRMALYLYVFGL